MKTLIATELLSRDFPSDDSLVLARDLSTAFTILQGETLSGAVIHRALLRDADNDLMRQIRRLQPSAAITEVTDHPEETRQLSRLLRGADATFHGSETTPPMVEKTQRLAQQRRTRVRTTLAEDRRVVFVVDDDEYLREEVVSALQEAGYDASGYDSGEDVLLAIRERPVHVLVTDIRMPGLHGTEVVSAALRYDPSIVSVVMTGHASLKASVDALHCGARAWIQKPADRDNLLRIVSQAWDEWALGQNATLLAQSEAKYRALFSAVGDAIFVCDATTHHIVDANPAATRLLGNDLESLRTQPFPSFCASSSGRPESAQTELRRCDGTTFAAEVHKQAIELDDRPHLLITARDVTERILAKQLRNRMVERVLEAQEQERRRIARDLHDHTGQVLTSLLLKLSAIHGMTDSLPTKMELEQTREQVRALIDDVSRVARGMHTTAFDDLGFRKVIHREIEEVRHLHGVDVVLDLDEALESERPPGPRILTVYRIMQEALTNAIRHADASRIAVRIAQDTQLLSMEIIDDGQGFPDHATDGLGLQSMRERAELLGGTLRVKSSPGGTTITVELPVL